MNLGRLLERHRPASRLRRDGGYVPGDKCLAIPNDVRVRTRTDRPGRRWHLRRQCVCGEREVNHKSVVVHAEVENRAEESLRWCSTGRKSRRMMTPPSRMRQRRTWCWGICLSRLPSKINALGKWVYAGYSEKGQTGGRRRGGASNGGLYEVRP